jgi:hypothetical protein
MCDSQSWCLRTSVARSAGNARQAARSIARLTSEEDLRTNDSRQQFRRTSARYACPPCFSPAIFLADAVVDGCNMTLQSSNHSKCVVTLLREDNSSLSCESAALMMIEAHPRRSSANDWKRWLVKLSLAFLLLRMVSSSEPAGASASASTCGLRTQDASHESVSQTIANTAAESNKQLIATSMQTKHCLDFCFRR